MRLNSPVITERGNLRMKYRFWFCFSLIILFIAGCSSDGGGDEACDNPRLKIAIDSSGELVSVVTGCESSSNDVTIKNAVYNSLQQLVSCYYEVTSRCGDFYADVYDLEYNQSGKLENGFYDYNNCVYPILLDENYVPPDELPGYDNSSVSFAWPDICTSGKVITVVAEIYLCHENRDGQSSCELTATGHFDCTDMKGTIFEISPGTDYKVVLSGKNAQGIKIYQGEKSGVLLAPFEDTNIGTIRLDKLPGAE